ncbi:unnamed protein product [Adineta ricciae]|uniref:Arrestin C-terminal-like domain-containing protein n=1 Tax=Adineta ricciae TaxID=249248 RepID=A0A815REN1_ADIRI|nr:unnamed protein product [Adineta ricciae]
MGNGTSSSIAINLDRSNEFYFTNEIISGTVELTIVEGRIEVEEIFMKLTGELSYTSASAGRDNKVHSTTQTDYHHIPFFSRKTIFAQPKPGQRFVYGQGRHSWPFQISLDEHLPPTMNQPQLYPNVRYYLQVVIDKSWYKPSTKERKIVAVYPHVNLSDNPQCLQLTTFGNHNRKDLTLKGTLNKSGFVPGESVQIKLEIANPQRLLIKNIICSIFQIFCIGPIKRESNILQSLVPNIMNSRAMQFNETFSIEIPGNITLAPSYKYQSASQQAAIVVNDYVVRFAVKVEGLFDNFEVNVPIILGTDQNSGIAAGIPAAALTMNDDDDDLPPSYDSIVHDPKYQKQEEKTDEESFF